MTVDKGNPTALPTFVICWNFLNVGKMNTKRKIIYGVAHNDYAGSIKENGRHIRAYRSWISMLSRCYGKSELENRPTYKGCQVCKEWLYFSNFKKWFDDPNNWYQDGYCLDKDILVNGNKIYSPETCSFVPNEINTLLSDTNKSHRKPDSVKGIYKTKFNTFIAGYRNGNGKRVHLGSFKTLDEAKLAYSTFKENRVKKIAQEYFDKGKITFKVYNALMNYKTY